MVSVSAVSEYAAKCGGNGIPLPACRKSIEFLSQTFIRFAAIGVLGTLVYVAGVVGAVEYGQFDPRLGHVCGYALALPVSYWGHYRFSFASVHRHRSTILRFLAIYALCFAVGQGIMNATVFMATDRYGMAVMLIIVVQPVLSFVLNKLLVFRRHERLLGEIQ